MTPHPPSPEFTAHPGGAGDAGATIASDPERGSIHGDPRKRKRISVHEINDKMHKTVRRFRTPWNIRAAIGKEIYSVKHTVPPRSWRNSCSNLFKTVSWMWVFLIALPFAWIAHWNVDNWGHHTTFWLCFTSMIVLQRIFDICAEELAVYLGMDFEGFIVVTVSNAIEATLAIILLLKCELRLLQSTVVGVMLLHLLLVPGTEFFIRGVETYELILHPLDASINTSLLMVGVLSMALPTAYFASLDSGPASGTPTQTSNTGLPPKFVPIVSDFVRREVLRMSRGVSVILLVIYAVSRFYRHLRPLPGNESAEGASSQASARRDQSGDSPGADPMPSFTARPTSARPRQSLASEPNKDNTVQPPHNITASVRENANASGSTDARKSNMDLPVLVVTLFVTVGLMAPTAEFLVSSIEGVRESLHIQTEFFGLVILPLVSFSSDGIIAIYKFIWKQRDKFWAPEPKDNKPSDTKPIVSGDQHGPGDNSGADTSAQDEDVYYDGELPSADTRLDPQNMAHGRPIDLSIQFATLWTPMLVLLGWWIDRPMHLLFDYLEVALVLGACLLVNFVTFDQKTNISEGVTLLGFYAMITTVVWFYPGQPQVAFMLTCPGSVAQAVAEGVEQF